MHHRTVKRIAPAFTLATSTLLLSVTIAGPASAAASHPNSLYQIGVGSGPSLTVGSDGTGFVAFDHESVPGTSDDSVQLCRIPRGTRGCASVTTIPFTLDSHGSGPAVFVPAPGEVEILSSRCCDTTTTTLASLQIATSTDNGATFSAPVTVAPDIPASSAVSLAGGRFAAITTESEYGLQVQTFGPTGAAAPVSQQPITSDVYGGTLATTADGGLLAAHYNSIGSNPDQLNVQRWTPAAGDPSLASSWTTVLTAPGSNTRLASGPSGTFLFDETDGPYNSASRYEVRKWTGSGFTSPVALTPGGENNLQSNFSEDASGRLHAVYRGDNNDLYQRVSTDGVHWSKAQDLASSSVAGFYDNVAVTAADGGGFAVSDSDSDGPVYAVAIAVPRTVATKVDLKHAKVVGSVHPYKKGQPLLLQERTGKHWITVAKGSIAAQGSFTFKEPKHKKSIAVRVIASAVEGYLEGDGGSVGLK